MRGRLFKRSNETTSPANSNRPDQPTAHIRPLHRSPVATLTILDDGTSRKGETIRIRRHRHVIGREQGDTRIPHDHDISTEHAAITCHWRDGAYLWQLVDLDSTNGTFVRVFRSSLHGESELLLGSHRYLFLAAEVAQPHSPNPPEGSGSTHRFANPSPAMPPRLIEAYETEDRRVFNLPTSDVLIGRHPEQCDIVLDGDPFISSRHARLRRDESGKWLIEDQKSLNGVLLRISRTTLDRETEFQLGEQRFRFKPPKFNPVV